LLGRQLIASTNRACAHACLVEAILVWCEWCLDATFRPLYEASDGLCLPHLHEALALAEHIHPEAARFLVCATVQRLEGLASDLDEYIRKHAWKYRHELVTEEEEMAAYRTSLLFGGLDRYELELGKPDPTSQSLTRDRLKQMGLRIDE
jgi:hypothetical protein